MRGILNTERIPGLIFIITGPSGIGKTTLYRKLLDRHPQLQRIITTTSRPMRPEEIDGKDYYFITPVDFEAKIAAGDFYEYASVYGEWKGVAKKTLNETLEKGTDVLLSVDVQGALTYRKLRQEESIFKDRLVIVFLTPKDTSVLKERLVNRGGLDAEALNKRLSEAEIEIKQARNFDYVLTSSTPDDDFRQIEALYYKTKIHYIKKYQLNLLNR